jgi:uncharacterized protein YyaL (SSP411 family)
MIELAEETLKQASALMHQSPASVGQMLIALDHFIGPSAELVYLARDADAKQRALEHAFGMLRPRTLIVLALDQGEVGNSLASSRLTGLVEGRGLAGDASLVVYRCSGGTCQSPELL